MSLFGALSASLTALTSQSRAVNVISNNISNLSTTGFKSSNVSFSTLVAGTIGGGVVNSVRQSITTQGSISSTGNATDLAIQGAGFFTVKDETGTVYYTRSGSFNTDDTGRLVNEAGFILQGWPLDSEGRLPGESGNANTTSNQNLTSLEDVSTTSITGSASPTSSVTAKINLKAEEGILTGAGATIEPASDTNLTNSSTDIIIPQSFAVGATLTATNSSGATVFTYGGIELSLDLSTANAGAGVAGATSASAPFNTSTGWVDGDDFTIETASTGAPVTFTFKTSNPNTNNNEFRTLNDLATVIGNTTGLRARVDGAVLYIASTDPQDAIDFTNGVSSTIITDLGLADVASSTGNRFASLGDLANYVNDTTDLVGTLASASSNATLAINNVDPTDTITFTSSDADLLTEFALNSTEIAAAYDATSSTQNMASGSVSPDFSRTITIYDSLGRSLDLTLAFTKLSDSGSAGHTWAAELYSADPDAVSNGDDGLIAYGVIAFNGDGTLRDISGPTVGSTSTVFSFGGEIIISPVGAEDQTLTLNLGTQGALGEGLADGLSQFAGQYTVDAIDQNGFPTGRLQALQIDTEGFVTAVFDNSLTQQVFRLPLAYFPNSNGLTAVTGNAYSASTEAGTVTLGQVGNASVGTFVPEAVESSTADLGGELTALLVAQQAYSASANVLTKVSELFDELKRI